MSSSHSPIRYSFEECCDYLNAIDRTRLLFDSTEDLAVFIGYKSANQSLSKYGGKSLWAKYGMLEALNGIMIKQEDSSYDLFDLLNDYRQASEYYSRFRRHRYFSSNKDSFAELLAFYYSDNQVISDGQLLQDISLMNDDRVDETDSIIPLLILISAQIIPTYGNKKGGDADSDEEFEKMIELVIQMVEHSKVFTIQPVISKYRAIHDNGIRKNRFYLIRTFECILNTLGNTTSHVRMEEAVKQIPALSINLNGLWHSLDTNEYWGFSPLDNSNMTFFAYRYTNIESPVWLYTRYELVVLFDEEFGFSAVLSDSLLIHDILEYGHIFTEHQAFLDFEYDDLDNPQRITFIDKGLGGIKAGCTLSRLSSKEQAAINKRIKKVAINDDFDYEFTGSAQIITPKHIYFPVPDCENYFFKVPLIDEFKNKFLNELFVLKCNKYTAVGCGINVTYLDVTTEEKRAKHGIEIVETDLS